MEQKIELTSERKELYSLNHGVCLTAKVYGDLVREKFELALYKTVKKYSVLNSRICFSDIGERSLIAIDDRKIEPLYYPYGEVNYIEKHIEQEERMPYDLENGPLCRVIVFKGEERSVILLMASSMIADGISLRIMMESIVYYMNHEMEMVSEQEDTMLSLKESTISDASLRLSELFKVEHINRLWKKQSHTFSKEEYLYHYEAYHKTHKTPVLMKEIHSRSTKSLLKNCREKEVSVESALLTAFLAVMNTFDRTHSGKEILIHYAVDLRSELIVKGNPLVGKFDSFGVLRKQYTTGLSFWDNVKSLDNYLKEKLRNKRQYMKGFLLSRKLDKSLLESLPIQEYGGFDNIASKKALELFDETNKEHGIGLYFLKEMSYNPEEEYYIDALNLIPPAWQYNDMTIGACIVNEKLRLCIRYDRMHYSERIVEDMVRAAVNYMWNRSENKEIKKPLAK